MIEKLSVEKYKHAAYHDLWDIVAKINDIIDVLNGFSEKPNNHLEGLDEDIITLQKK